MTLTIEDIRNPSRKSGFAGVTANAGSAVRPYQARHGWKIIDGSGIPDWIGPRRATAEEAARDLIAHVNSGNVPPRSVKRSHDHVPVPFDIEKAVEEDPEVKAARGVIRDAEGQKAGKPGYVYLIVEQNKTGIFRYVKIGYTTNPPKRVPELQTGNRRTLLMLCYMPGTLQDETALHHKYHEFNAKLEWYHAKPSMLEDFKDATRVHPYKKVRFVG